MCRSCLIVALYSQHYLQDCYRDCTFCIEHNSIETVDSFSHLGHAITDDLDDSMAIENRCHDSMNRTNNVLCYFRNMGSCVKYRLFKSFCMSLYGCELWSLSSKAIINRCVACVCAGHEICLTKRIARFCRCFAICCRFWMKFVKDVSIFYIVVLTVNMILSALLLYMVLNLVSWAQYSVLY
jgi:hypothetical protein